MKIKTRNRFITLLMIISLGMLLLNGVIFAFKLYEHSFYFPEIITFKHLQNFYITKFNYIAVVSAVFALMLYIFFYLLSITVEFEKTQSTEIIYFSVFLFGFLFESLRLLFPYLDLWHNSSRLSIIITRGILFGRTLAPLSLLFTVIYSNFESRQYVEQNLLILVAVAIFFATSIPLNTNIIFPTGMILLGFGKLIITLQIVLLSVAVIALIIKSVQNHYSPSLTTGFFLLTAGYILLIEGSSILTAAAGSIAAFYGTFLYLKKLHGQYLWN